VLEEGAACQVSPRQRRDDGGEGGEGGRISTISAVPWEQAEGAAEAPARLAATQVVVDATCVPGIVDTVPGETADSSPAMTSHTSIRGAWTVPLKTDQATPLVSPAGGGSPPKSPSHQPGSSPSMQAEASKEKTAIVPALKPPTHQDSLGRSPRGRSGRRSRDIVEKKWQWKHRTGWRDYGADVSAEIERAFQTGDSKARLKSGKKGNQPMEIFFAGGTISGGDTWCGIELPCDTEPFYVDMLQYDASSGSKRGVQRVGPDPWWQRALRGVRTYVRAWETGRPRRENYDTWCHRDSALRSASEPADETTSLFHEAALFKRSGRFQAIARSKYFKTWATILVGANAVWQAVELDCNPAVMLSDADIGFQILEHSFCALFALEILVRLLAYHSPIIAMKDAWFRFDAVLVIMMVGELWLLPVALLAVGAGQSSAAMGNFQVLRMARLVRLTRMTRLFKSAPELITLIKGISTAIRPVTYTLILLLTLLYVFGVVFRSQMKKGSYLEDTYFSSVIHSISTCLLHATFLDSVSVVAEDIGSESLMLLGIFYLCILLTNLTVLNMLIGITCEMVSVVKQCEEERLAKATLMSQLYDILTVYDSDGGNSLQKHEFDLFMRNVEVKEVLQNFEVDYTGFLTLVEVLYEAGDLERVDTLESDENSGKHSRQSNHSIMTEVIREPALSFDEILDLVVRLKGDNTPTVQDIVQLRQYTKQRLEKLETKILNRLDETLAATKTVLSRAENLALEQPPKPAPGVGTLC